MARPMTKKLDANPYDTDKKQLTHYLANYEEHFAPFVDKEVRLLELGIHKGGSLQLWRDYFPKGGIAGLDLMPVTLEDASGRIRTYQGLQQDTDLLDRIARETAPEGFDIIIDDCSHIGEPTRISFWHLFENHLKPGGIYAIEDWGTGYWDRWVDGRNYRPGRPSLRSRLLSFIERLRSGPKWRKRISKRRNALQRFPSHDYGMVGFVKELIDECGTDSITQFESARRGSRFESMNVSPGQVVIVKATDPEHPPPPTTL